ncbi:ABC transporter substrate-binding protein [Thermomonospora amylolytica]|uniref:ABC transporter substrate-binding protein n=1 Tax=Thermomonospora amylolytica TaxID=1411117 RepID=UPI000E6B4EAC|nr:ABC transporter substrate-binding protein [Thermomonospora amylolytica]
MKRTWRTAGVAATAALALVLSGCGGGGTGGDDTVNTTFNQAVNTIVNQDDKAGGTLKFAITDAPDSVDPGNTYYAFNWDFTRLYARALLTFDNKPGEAGLKVVPDLAEGLGTPSEDGKTWTYKIRKGIKYEDGTEVKAADVKYAIARSNYTDELTSGPKYFAQYLDAGDYKGPYKDKNLDNFKGIETPDDYTLVFKLKQPFYEFDYLLTNPQSAPVPAAKDTGLKYQEHPVATGPYKVESHQVGKSLVLVKNPMWNQASDPIRKQNVDRIELAMGVNGATLDEQLLAGTTHVNLGGTGVEAAAQAKILRQDKLKRAADNPLTGFLRYAMLSTKVKPFDNIECRKAVQYAVDKTAIQGAYGGPIAGDIASTALPPTETGHTKYDLYPTPGNKGDLNKAKAALQACGQPNGFETNIAVREDRAKEVAAAEAIQQSLAKVGIRTQIKKFPSGDYTSQYAGKPEYVHKNNLGIIIAGWGSDWPTGFGFLSQIAHGEAIKPSGNYNEMELNDPEVNRLLDEGIRNPNQAEREKAWSQVDRKVMESAALLPFIYEKVLTYRPPSLTNVYFHEAYKMYDYTALGVK